MFHKLIPLLAPMSSLLLHAPPWTKVSLWQSYGLASMATIEFTH